LTQGKSGEEVNFIPVLNLAGVEFAPPTFPNYTRNVMALQEQFLQLFNWDLDDHSALSQTIASQLDIIPSAADEIIRLLTELPLNSGVKHPFTKIALTINYGRTRLK